MSTMTKIVWLIYFLIYLYGKINYLLILRKDRMYILDNNLMTFSFTLQSRTKYIYIYDIITKYWAGLMRQKFWVILCYWSYHHQIKLQSLKRTQNIKRY